MLDRSTPEAAEVQPFWLWPENVDAWSLFLAVRTQWRPSFDGPSEGLDYAGVETVVRRLVRPKHRKLRWDELQAMEHACLEVWREKRQ